MKTQETARLDGAEATSMAPSATEQAAWALRVSALLEQEKLDQDFLAMVAACMVKVGGK